MRKFKVVKDTFKHDRINSIVTIVENIDMPKVKDVKDGYTFFCPMDNLEEVTLEYFWYRFQMGLAFMIFALLLVLFIHGFINGWIKDVLIWGFALVGWFTVLLKIKKEVL